MTHVILLLHGIRDFGGWMGRAKDILEGAARNVKVVPVRFGYYDVLSFLAPWDKTGKPYQTLLTAYESAIEGREAEVRVSVVAHSFGTYLVGRLLQDNRTVRLHRVLLCGSVVKRDFDWHNLIGRFDDAGQRGDRVRNECGNKDPWPILAQVANGRCGDAGRHGFANEVHSTTIHYNGGHSLFFEEQHMRNAWAGFLLGGENRDGNARAPEPTWIERATTWPFVTRFLRLFLVYPLWFVLYFWWSTVALALFGVGAIVYASFSGSDSGRTIDLANYIRHIEQNSVTHDEALFDQFVHSLCAPDAARVNFAGAIVKIGASERAQNGGRSVVLLPADCDWIGSGSEGILVQFDDEALPDDMDFTALAPSGNTYKTVWVVAQIENIVWFDGSTDGRIFADGIRLEMAGQIDCGNGD